MKKENNMCCSHHDDYWYHANKIGLLFILLFAICFFWPYFHADQIMLHIQIMDMSFFGFTGLNWPSFVSGVIQSYFWGYIVVIIWKIVCLSSCCDESSNCCQSGNCETVPAKPIAKTKKRK